MRFSDHSPPCAGPPARPASLLQNWVCKHSQPQGGDGEAEISVDGEANKGSSFAKGGDAAGKDFSGFAKGASKGGDAAGSSFAKGTSKGAAKGIDAGEAATASDEDAMSVSSAPTVLGEGTQLGERLGELAVSINVLARSIKIMASAIRRRSRSPPPEPPPALPWPWEQHFSEEHERTYYWNSETGEAVWLRPR